MVGSLTGQEKGVSHMDIVSENMINSFIKSTRIETETMKVANE